jgi:hypothetical protein
VDVVAALRPASKQLPSLAVVLETHKDGFQRLVDNVQAGRFRSRQATADFSDTVKDYHVGLWRALGGQ